MSKTICVFGDSTAWGAWDKEKGGWVNRLWLYFAEKDPDAELYNMSISGGTTRTILARFEQEAKTREADMLIFQSGGNDAYCRGVNGKCQIPEEEFRKNVESIIEKGHKIVKHIVFVGFNNVDESRTVPVSWRGIYYTNENIKRYSEIMKEVCRASNVPFLEIFGLLDNEDLEDGLHPNAHGHQKIFKAVKDFLEKKL
jgi:lysophospholipase L1-like esterase